mmetsp:Transcript_39002/g.120526  ORF Transcript_39002/g.120526 Transcript_39002/m.120526 type:complete len:370 (-) Transcript_39002:2056-3165(-)
MHVHPELDARLLGRPVDALHHVQALLVGPVLHRALPLPRARQLRQEHRRVQLLRLRRRRPLRRYRVRALQGRLPRRRLQGQGYRHHAPEAVLVHRHRAGDIAVHAARPHDGRRHHRRPPTHRVQPHDAHAARPPRVRRLRRRRPRPRREQLHPHDRHHRQRHRPLCPEEDPHPPRNAPDLRDPVGGRAVLRELERRRPDADQPPRAPRRQHVRGPVVRPRRGRRGRHRAGHRPQAADGRHVQRADPRQDDPAVRHRVPERDVQRRRHPHRRPRRRRAVQLRRLLRPGDGRRRHVDAAHLPVAALPWRCRQRHRLVPAHHRRAAAVVVQHHPGADERRRVQERVLRGVLVPRHRRARLRRHVRRDGDAHR